MNIYVAILLGLVFTVVYSAVNTFLYNMNYKRMNHGRSMEFINEWSYCLNYGWCSDIFVLF